MAGLFTFSSQPAQNQWKELVQNYQHDYEKNKSKFSASSLSLMTLCRADEVMLNWFRTINTTMERKKTCLRLCIIFEFDDIMQSWWSNVELVQNYQHNYGEKKNMSEALRHLSWHYDIMQSCKIWDYAELQNMRLCRAAKYEIMQSCKIWDYAELQNMRLCRAAKYEIMQSCKMWSKWCKRMAGKLVTQPETDLDSELPPTLFSIT